MADKSQVKEMERILALRGISLDSYLGKDFCLEDVSSRTPFWHVFGNLLQGLEEMDVSQMSYTSTLRYLGRVIESREAVEAYLDLLGRSEPFRTLQFDNFPTDSYLSTLTGGIVRKVRNWRKYHLELPTNDASRTI